MVLYTKSSQLTHLRRVDSFSTTLYHQSIYNSSVSAYYAFDIFQKVVFCLALYTEEVNLQTFVMIYCKTIRRNYYAQKVSF